ncbi:hypothetical protein EDC04DRAFT_2604028 [Pisolithus marmoratus]|nr:hypothetical protein EDC04DRAFT_2604028 [Pisolithus marmoratus]
MWSANGLQRSGSRPLITAGPLANLYSEQRGGADCYATFVHGDSEGQPRRPWTGAAAVLLALSQSGSGAWRDLTKDPRNFLPYEVPDAGFSARLRKAPEQTLIWQVIYVFDEHRIYSEEQHSINCVFSSWSWLSETDTPPFPLFEWHVLDEVVPWFAFQSTQTDRIGTTVAALQCCGFSQFCTEAPIWVDNGPSNFNFGKYALTNRVSQHEWSLTMGWVLIIVSQIWAPVGPVYGQRKRVPFVQATAIEERSFRYISNVAVCLLEHSDNNYQATGGWI